MRNSLAYYPAIVIAAMVLPVISLLDTTSSFVLFYALPLLFLSAGYFLNYYIIQRFAINSYSALALTVIPTSFITLFLSVQLFLLTVGGGWGVFFEVTYYLIGLAIIDGGLLAKVIQIRRQKKRSRAIVRFGLPFFAAFILASLCVFLSGVIWYVHSMFNPPVYGGFPGYQLFWTVALLLTPFGFFTGGLLGHLR